VKRKVFSFRSLPKIITLLLFAGLIVFAVIGFIRDLLGNACTGFMGVEATCIEEMVAWPYGVIALPLIILFSVWWLMASLPPLTRKK
jgi:hypothetical protein